VFRWRISPVAGQKKTDDLIEKETEA